MFIYHAYINPAHYQNSQVLCEDLSIQLTDILHKLHTEAMNLLTMELYARNQLNPGPGHIVTDTMTERLFIMVCRHFAQLTRYYPFVTSLNPSCQRHFTTIVNFTKHYTACSFLSVLDDYLSARTMIPIIQISSLQTPKGLISTD